MNRIFLIVLSAALLLTSCASKEHCAAYGFTGPAGSNKLPVGDQELAPDDRKMVYNASLDMEPKTADTTNIKLMDIAHRHGGYILKTGPDMASIRVRSEDLHPVLSEIALIGQVRNQHVTGNDVTEEYSDLEITLDNLKKTRNRYLELLQKANNVDETLKVEKELERLSTQIDLIEGKLNRLSHLVAYSTIDIYYRHTDLDHHYKPGPLGYVFVGLYKGVKWLFVRG